MESILIKVASSRPALDSYFERSWERTECEQLEQVTAFRTSDGAKLKRKPSLRAVKNENTQARARLGEALCPLGARDTIWEAEQSPWSSGVACAVLQVVLIFPSILFPPPTCRRSLPTLCKALSLHSLTYSSLGSRCFLLPSLSKSTEAQRSVVCPRSHCCDRAVTEIQART